MTTTRDDGNIDGLTPTERQTITNAPTIRRLADDLRRAAGLVRRAVAQLDRDAEQCGACHRRHPVNVREAQAFDALNPVVEKLSRWANVLEYPEEWTPQGAKIGRRPDGRRHMTDEGENR